MQIIMNYMYAIYFTDNGQERLVRHCTSMDEFKAFLDTVESPEQYVLRNINLTAEEQAVLNRK